MKLNVHLRCNSNFLKVFLSQWVSVNFLRSNIPDFFLYCQFSAKEGTPDLHRYCNEGNTKETFTGSDEFLTAPIVYTLQA